MIEPYSRHCVRFSSFSSLDPIWTQFASENTSLEFFRTASQFFFSPIIDKLYPGLLSKLASIPVGPRTLDPKLDSQSALTDFQLVSNLPRSDSHTSRTPHLDNPQQLYALLYYVRDDADHSIGGGLQLYKPKKSAFTAPHNRGEVLILFIWLITILCITPLIRIFSKYKIFLSCSSTYLPANNCS